MAADDADGEIAGSGAPSRTCRICFEGESIGKLIAPCKCRGTHGYLHEACLLRWRRLQVLQGRRSAANRCEICGANYAGEKVLPTRRTLHVAIEFGRELCDTLLVLLRSWQWTWVVYLCPFFASPFLGTLGRGLAFLGMLSFPCLVLVLYNNGLRLSFVNLPNNGRRLALTHFGPPVEGLAKGILLVSLQAGGCFSNAVLYVIEHDDGGSLAVILNLASRSTSFRASAPQWGTCGSISYSSRFGGPVEMPAYHCIHNIRDARFSHRIMPNEAFRERPLFYLDNVRSPDDFIWSVAQDAKEPAEDKAAGEAKMLFFRGISSWRDGQLEGEVRRKVWGWIPATHVRPEDLLQPHHGALLTSRHLRIFED